MPSEKVKVQIPASSRVIGQVAMAFVSLMELGFGVFCFIVLHWFAAQAEAVGSAIIHATGIGFLGFFGGMAWFHFFRTRKRLWG